MLNLRMYSQGRVVVIPGNLANPMLGMDSSQVPSIMGTRSPGMTTMMGSSVMPVTTHSYYTERPQSKLIETLERFGAPVMENGTEYDGSYQEIFDLPMYPLGDLHPSSGSLRTVR